MITEFKMLDRMQSDAQMNTWIQSQGQVLPKLSSDYQKVREEIEELFYKAVQEMEGKSIEQYEFDVRFGILFYQYLNSKTWFSLITASEDGFWRYLSLMVSPHLTSKRWKYDNQLHYWKKGTRIWFRTLWWYVHIGWKDNAHTTLKRLLDSRFSTDTIMHFNERTSNKGMNIELYRTFFDTYCQLPQEALSELREKNKGIHAGGVLGALFCLNTARILVMEPTFCEGGIEGYTRALFYSIGLDNKKYKL